MKKLILIIILAGSILSAYSQQMDTSYLRFMKQDLIRRSANNKKAGFILLGAGGVMVVGGIAGMISNPESLETFMGYSALTGFGMLAGLTSLPLFIIAGSQSLRAARIGAHVKLENHIQNLNLLSATTHSLTNDFSTQLRQIPVFPAISLRMEIGR